MRPPARRHANPADHLRLAPWLVWTADGIVASLAVGMLLHTWASGWDTAKADTTTAPTVTRSSFVAQTVAPLEVPTIRAERSESVNPTVATPNSTTPETALSAPWSPADPTTGVPVTPQASSDAPSATQTVAPTTTPPVVTTTPTTTPPTTTTPAPTTASSTASSTSTSPTTTPTTTEATVTLPEITVTVMPTEETGDE